ncbi:MAG: amine dehydrogenase large subunit, partial [Gammaproteobacteria bacterium]
MRATTILSAGLALLLGLGTANAELAPEKLTKNPLRPANPHRIYLTDLALGHVIDGRIHVIDGDNFDYLGLIPTGLFGLTALSNDSSEMYVATTYYTKRNRGDRFDLFEVYDTATLELEAEVEIPAKHAQALPYKGTMAASADGRFVM